MIGRGNYGEVWLAQNVMGTYRGVKVVHRSSFDNDGPYEREFAGIRKFEPISRSHESQLDLLQIGRNNAAGYFYYVMELADDAEQGPDIGVVEGPADGKPRTAQRARTPALRPSDTPTHRDPSTPLLHDPQAYVPRTLEHDLKGGGRLPFEECLRISLALAGALRHLHGHGLVHRDIKPGNIIFINGIPKLADIGLVTDSDATLICFGGSQGFSAPEGPGRPQGDIYSLGKVIYEMCTGQDRMDFPKLPEDFGKWPDRKHVCEMLAVINKACEPDLANRYGSAEQLSKDLVMVQAGKSVRRLRWLERHRRWALAALAVTMGAAVVVSSFLKSWVLRQEILRVGFIRAAQAASFTEHQAGWRRKALENLQKAEQIRLDDDIRAEAVDVFAGPDVTNRPPLINGGADHLVFDAQGRRLLMDGGLEGQRQGSWTPRRDNSPNSPIQDAGPSGSRQTALRASCGWPSRGLTRLWIRRMAARFRSSSLGPAPTTSNPAKSCRWRSRLMESSGQLQRRCPEPPATQTLPTGAGWQSGTSRRVRR